MSQISLSLFGSFEVSLDDGPPITQFGYQKVAALLAYLCLESSRPQRREVLAEMLWPNQPGATARHNLRQALTTLRRLIGTHDLLTVTRDTLQLDRAGGCQLDTDKFSALLAECKTHAHRHADTCEPCMRRLQQAAALYRGRLLDGSFLSDSTPFEEWVLFRREQFHRQVMEILPRLVGHFEQRREYPQALEYCWSQLRLEPWREESHQQVMHVLALTGQRSAALAQFETCRRILAEEMGVDPSAETMALYQRIRATDAPITLGGMALGRDLPVPLTPLVGREAELALIIERLENPGCRLLTITGPAGNGKTRAAIQGAEAARSTFRYGVCFVALDPENPSTALTASITAALALPAGERELFGFLRDKDLLLVLDGCEGLPRDLGVLAEVMRRAPQVRFLATARARLNLQAEWLVDLAGLSVPAGPDELDLLAYGAVKLFVERAGRVQAGFALGDRNRTDVVRICQRVAGSPLGIELAAGRVRHLSCAQIAERLTEDFDVLETSMSDVPERQRSFRAVFEGAWRLLSPNQQVAARALSALGGDFQPQQARAVGVDDAQRDALVDRAWLRVTPGGSYAFAHPFLAHYARRTAA